jgi:hypothetical protein
MERQKFELKVAVARLDGKDLTPWENLWFQHHVHNNLTEDFLTPEEAEAAVKNLKVDGYRLESFITPLGSVAKTS